MTALQFPSLPRPHSACKPNQVDKHTRRPLGALLGLVGTCVLTGCPGAQDTNTADPDRGELVAISISPFSPTLQVGTEQRMQVRGFYEDESSTLIDAATWVSDNERVATIDGTGLAMALADGSATLFASVGELGARTTVRVREPSDDPVTIVAVPAQARLSVGDSVAIAANATYEDGQQGNISGQCGWNSSDAAIATVEQGLVTAIRAGEATISVDCGPRSPNPVSVVVSDGEVTQEPPDLDITFFEGTVVGDEVVYDIIVSNTGSGPAAGFWVDLFANSSGPPTTESDLDDLAWVPELAAGASLPLQFQLAGLPTGSLQSWVSADLDNRVQESSDTNNLEGPLTLSVSADRADLTVGDFEALSDSESTYFEATVTNSGSAAAGGFWVDLFVDSVADPVIDDLGDDFVWVDGLNAGASTTVEFLVDDAPSTSWSSVVFADTNATVDESDESNNQARTTVE